MLVGDLASSNSRGSFKLPNTVFAGLPPSPGSIGVDAIVTHVESYMMYICSAAFVIVALCIAIHLGMTWIKGAAKNSGDDDYYTDEKMSELNAKYGAGWDK